MTKHALKNNKHQDSKNRFNTVTSVGPDSSYQAKPQGTGDYSTTTEDFISEQSIQKRAYEIYQQKGGSELENWLEAEKILREEQRSSS